ncbi:muramoyltetrapeptide carboxypeptidase [Escherichia coli]|uniref:Muramoyltetrapeptide carboxypeptidase n=1 Tax=Escherichia coli TaxID=562 RepID=A0A484WQX7_ECOLX|nr:muramoyltetrapeptide carboxypeptidase [Escherichia coli]
MSLFHLIAHRVTALNSTPRCVVSSALPTRGIQVNNVEVIARRCERFAGTETERLEDLNSLAQTDYPQHHRAVCTRRLRCQSFTGRY